MDEPCIGLLLPEGIEVVGGDYRIEPPATGEWLFSGIDTTSRIP